MADPTVIQCASACTVTVEHLIHIPVLDLSIDDAKAIGGAILLVWAIAVGFRHLGRLISSGATNRQESE